VTAVLHRARHRPSIADIVAFAYVFDADERRTAREITARDNRIAQGLGDADTDRLALALAWIDAVKREDETVRSIHQRAETSIHLTSVLIAVAGVLLGWGATMALFYFDGSRRVNVVSVFATLVALPGVLIVPFIFATLTPSIMRRVPGAKLVGETARALGPGRLASLFWRAFPSDLRNAMTLISGRAQRHASLYSGVQKWAILRWSQQFAVSFQITTLLTCLVLVVFTDLAFGWSTTLTTGDPALDARRVHHVTSTVSAPWALLLDDGNPSLELIEDSRYYRVSAESVSRAQAARLGSWWKFVLMTIAMYGLLPRIITLAVAQSRLRAAGRAAVTASPGISALLRRLHRAQIETRAVQAESGNESPSLPDRGDRVSQQRSGNIRAVINWSEVPVRTEVLASTFPATRIFAAGGAAAVQDDITLAKQIGENAHEGGTDVLILVKAWEPPLMEFIDFLKILRGALGPQSIVVWPVGLDDGGGLGTASRAQFKVWRDKLASIGDPWLRVTSSREEAYL
jgi:hypothetical protein